MACLVSKDTHTLLFGCTFDLEHLAALQFHEAGVCQVEGNGEAGHTVRSEPFLRYPNVGPKAKASYFKLGIKPLDSVFKRRPFDAHGKIPESQIQKFFLFHPA
jgi:hypothetical protein